MHADVPVLPEVSVLVPICNVEKYLRECLESLAAQQNVFFEALLLNDGSTDESGSIAHEFADRDDRFIVVDKENSGYGDTLNLGLSKARGAYLGILESDDIMYPGALAKLLSAAKAHDADVARGTFSLYWSDGPRDVLVNPYDSDLLEAPFDAGAERRVFLYKPSIWSGLYRRSMLDDNDIAFLPTPGASYQDTSFTFKTYACSKRTVLLPDPIIHYRQDSEGSSVRSASKVYAVGTEYDEIGRWTRAHATGERQTFLLSCALVARINAYLWNLDRIAPELRGDFARTIADEFIRDDARGLLDWNALDAWRTLNLKTLMADPVRYVSLRERFRGDSALSKVAFALALGGIMGLRSALQERSAR